MQATSIHLANVVGAAFFNTQIKVKHNGQRDKQRDRQTDREPDRQWDCQTDDIVLDKLMWQKGNKQSSTHTHMRLGTLCVHCYHIYRTWSFLNRTNTHKTKAAHYSLSWGIIQMKPMNLSISKCFPSKFIIRNCRRKIKITIKRRQKIFTPLAKIKHFKVELYLILLL